MSEPKNVDDIVRQLGACPYCELARARAQAADLAGGFGLAGEVVASALRDDAVAHEPDVDRLRRVLRVVHDVVTIAESRTREIAGSPVPHPHTNAVASTTAHGVPQMTAAKEARTEANLKTSSEGALACPSCGSECMHVDLVDVFARDHEDAGGMKVSVGLNSSYVDNDDAPFHRAKRVKAREIPGRRDSITITLRCEECWKGSQLRLQQHKGSTYAHWLTPTENATQPAGDMHGCGCGE